jgi:hypothetical protein
MVWLDARVGTLCFLVSHLFEGADAGALRLCRSTDAEHPLSLAQGFSPGTKREQSKGLRDASPRIYPGVDGTGNGLSEQRFYFDLSLIFPMASLQASRT